MDRKSIIVIVACMGLMFLWSSVLVPKLYPPIPAKTADARRDQRRGRRPNPRPGHRHGAAGGRPSATFIRPTFATNIEAAIGGADQ